jgi:hypothetical protein
MPERTEAERTEAEIEADIARTRDHLAGTLDTLAARVRPGNVVRRGAAAARARVVSPTGRPRPAALVGALGVLVALVGVAVVRRVR